MENKNIDIINKIKIHIQTAKEYIENFRIPNYVIFSTLERWSMKCHVAGSASQMYKRAKFN